MDYTKMSDYALNLMYQFLMYHIATEPNLQQELDKVRDEMTFRKLPLKETE